MAGCGSTSNTPAEHIAKLDARLHAMLTATKCNDKTLARFGEMGVHTVRDLTTLVDDRKDLRLFLKDALKLDFSTGGYEATLEIGHIVQAWEAAGKRVEVEDKRDAERLSANLPPQLTGEDVLLLKKQFEKNFNRGRTITAAQTPSKAYLELKVGHAETLWEAERLAEVTSLAQQERHRLKNAGSSERHMGWEERGDSVSFKIVTKPFGVPMPKDSEGLRARLRLLGFTYMFLKLKFPQKGVLATATKETFDNYTEFLFGDKVWNFATKGVDGQPNSCPHQDIVMGYDFAIRERVAELMVEGTDIDSAFEQAMKDEALKHTAFLCNFTLEHGSQRCRALSAPGFRDIHGFTAPEGPRKRALEDGTVSESPLSKSQKRNQARAMSKAKAAQQLALTNGAAAKGLGKAAKKALTNAHGGAPGGANKTKGKGKGKLKGKLTEGPNAGLGICFAYNDGTACKESPCPWAHACQICEGNHAKGDCPNK